MSKIAKEMIQRHEGLRLKPYRCSQGKLTIGYGRNLEDRGISLDEAELLFERDLSRVERELIQHLDFYEGLSPKGQAILLDIAFNLGIRGLLGFRKMLVALNEKNYEVVVSEIESSNWAKQVPRRAEELCDMVRLLKNEPPTIQHLQNEIENLKKEIAEMKK